MRKIIFATKNSGKVHEIKSLLKDKYKIISLNEISKKPKIIESGSSFLENAFIKAKSLLQAFPDSIVMGEDSGLSVDYLQGRPGIFSARYAGNHNDKKNIMKVLNELRGVPFKKRTAHFTTTIVLLGFPSKRKIFSKGLTRGHITLKAEGKDGFGYDPIFYSDELKKTFAQASITEKNSVSHRARAIFNLISQINS